jgi:hypothetical protein
MNDYVEYWVLVDPKRNRWKQVTMPEFSAYPVGEIRHTTAFPRTAIDQILYDSMQRVERE